MNNKKQIFIVDDDPMFSKALQHAAKSEDPLNIEVTLFNTGEDCINSMHKSPDIVIVDYFLNSYSPHAINGIEVLKKIKRSNPDTEVIMLSSQESIAKAMEALDLGAYHYLVKGEGCFLKLKDIQGSILEETRIDEYFEEDKARVGRVSIGVTIAVLIILGLSRMI